MIYIILYILNDLLVGILYVGSKIINIIKIVVCPFNTCNLLNVVKIIPIRDMFQITIS